MASGGTEDDLIPADGGIPLDIDNVRMLLHVEQQQIQKRTFTNWINAQLSKRCPPTSVSDLFSDLRDGERLLDLLEVMSGLRMTREKGCGVFQRRGNIETALHFLKEKSVKLVNINITDVMDGRPSIILGLVWTVILHCHIEELARTLSFSSRHSSLDSLVSSDSRSGSPASASPSPGGPMSHGGGPSLLHHRFRLSAKKALLMWVRDQCQRAGCSIIVRDFKSSWRSGVAFLAILHSVIPDLVDLSLAQSRSNQQNLEEAFDLAARELHIPRLLVPQDVDVEYPDEKSIITYVAQFLQYSNETPAPDGHLMASSNQRAQEVACWLDQVHEKLSVAWSAAETSSYVEKYQVFHSFNKSICEQRRPAMSLLAAMKRCVQPSLEQRTFRQAWDHLEGKLQQCWVELELSVPCPLDSIFAWLRCAEVELNKEELISTDHALAAKEARLRQDKLKTLIKEMTQHLSILGAFCNADESGAPVVPHEILEEMKRRLTNVRATAKYGDIMLEYEEHRHATLDILGHLRGRLRSWKGPYKSHMDVILLLQDWEETVERHGLLLILMDALQKLKQKAHTYKSKPALSEDHQQVSFQVQEVDREAALIMEAVGASRQTLERVMRVWQDYDRCLLPLRSRLAKRKGPLTMATEMLEMSESTPDWRRSMVRLNKVGNRLMEVTDPSTRLMLAEQLSELNRQWAQTMIDEPNKPFVNAKMEEGLLVVAAIKNVDPTYGRLAHPTRYAAQLPVQADTLTPPPPKLTISTEALVGFPRRLGSHLTQAQGSDGNEQRVQTPVDVVATSQQPANAEGIFQSRSGKSAATEKREGSPPMLTHTGQPERKDGRSLQPPALAKGEVRSLAQSMARSRLEKSRSRLQEHVQKAILLFGDKEMSERQAKRKQRALKALRPALIEEFLGALEGFGAFCSEAQLQDLMLLSESVRKQWQEVHSEMTAFLPMLMSEMGGGKRCVSAVTLVMHALNVHDATDTSDLKNTHQACIPSHGRESLGDAEHVESLQELCDTLAPENIICQAATHVKEAGAKKKTRRDQELLPVEDSDTAPPQDSRVAPPKGNMLTSATNVQPGSQPMKTPVQKANEERPRRYLSPPGDRGQLGSSVNTLPRSKQGSQRPSKDQLLKVQLLPIHQQQYVYLQEIVRGDTVESQQAVECTVIAQAAAGPSQEEGSSKQEALERLQGGNKLPAQLQQATEEEAEKTWRHSHLHREAFQPSEVISPKGLRSSEDGGRSLEQQHQQQNSNTALPDGSVADGQVTALRQQVDSSLSERTATLSSQALRSHVLMSGTEAQDQHSSTAPTTNITTSETLLREPKRTQVSTSSPAGARVSLSHHVTSEHDHRVALAGRINNISTELGERRRQQRVQQVREEALCLQTLLKDMAECSGTTSQSDDVMLKDMAECSGTTSESDDVTPDINQITQRWNALRDYDSRLKEFAVRVNDLQNTAEVAQGKLPPDVVLAVNIVAKELDSLRSSCVLKKRSCAVDAMCRVNQAVTQLQSWNQTAQASHSPSNQATLNEGLQLQQVLQVALSQQHSILNSIGERCTMDLEKRASEALYKSRDIINSLQGYQFGEELEMEAARGTCPARSPSSLGADDEEMPVPGPLLTMQDTLSEIQGLVEKSDIINRTQHVDLTWYLESCTDESEIRLSRTVSRVLGCRYQPAQLNVTAMANQLEEAEDYRCCVQEQVAAMKHGSAFRICDPVALRTMEERWSMALLDASATVQVKAAQLDQVTQYHRQRENIGRFIERLAAETEDLSLELLGSSTLQAEKLGALLQTMEQEKGSIKELLRLSSKLSPHLREAESSGALLAQLGDVQEEWRLIKGSIQRALRYASTSSSQSSRLLRQAQQLKANVETLQRSCTGLQSSQESHGNSCALELTCLMADLKTYNQLFLHIQSQSDALSHFSLGQQEKEEMGRVLQELQSSLNVSKSQLEDFLPSICGIVLPKVTKQLKDLVIWAKHAEHQIALGKTLALFPEEALIQIAEMRKLRSDIWSKQSLVSDIDKNNSADVLNSLKMVEDLYEAIAERSAQALERMERSLQKRKELLLQLANVEAWLADARVSGHPGLPIENASKAEMVDLEKKLIVHKLTTEKIENQLAVLDILTKNCGETVVELSPAESRYIVNRLSGLWTELDGMVAHERASSWELEELIHERTSSNEELTSIQASLKQISSDLEFQRFPLTHEALSATTLKTHVLMEHQFQVQELQHCQEDKRSSVLCEIGELQDRCKTQTVHAIDHKKYLHLQKEAETSRDIAEGQFQRSRDVTSSVGERFRLCQTLLVELPLVKTQCQEAADQLEAIAQNLNPSQLQSERQRIQSTVENLVTWEHAVTLNIKNVEAKLLEGLHLSSEIPTFMDYFGRIRQELVEAEPVHPEEKSIDAALQRCWVIWRNLESWMRVIEALGQKEKVNLRTREDLYSLRDACMHDCHSWMENLSQAREALKDYLWAARGATAFLHNAEATFLSAPGGFLDCTEEQRQTQHALASLEDVLQAHICHLVELVPHQPCLSGQKTEELHIGVLSHLLVGRATLEAQAHLRLEALERCARRQHSHWRCHVDVRALMDGLEASLSECTSEQAASYDKRVEQQTRAESLTKELHTLAGKLEDLRAGCPMQGCGVGKDGELSALWRRWASLRRGVSLLMAHSEQRREEWSDIATNCCSTLASLQAEVPVSSVEVTTTTGGPSGALSKAEMHQVGLEQEEQSIASLEHRLEHALSISGPQDPGGTGPLDQKLVEVQENVRSLKEQNVLLVAVEKERQRIQEEIMQVEGCVEVMFPTLESCFFNQQQEQILERSDPFHKLTSTVLEVNSGLEGLKTLLEKRSPSFPEAQSTLKRAWDELDTWHGRLILLESEAQDLAEEWPEQAQVLMDRLVGPLQLYQDTAQMAEQRTAFLGQVPACLQEFEDILHSASCWIAEAQSWLSAPCTYKTARSLHSHAKSFQVVLEDSERIRARLVDFGPLLQEISVVCDTRKLEERLTWTDRQVDGMQHSVFQPMDQLQHTATEIDAMELEVKTMEENVKKIRAILSSMDSSDLSEAERLQNRQVILANLQSMQKTVEEIERCKGELDLPNGAVDSLVVFPRAGQVLQELLQLLQLTQQHAAPPTEAAEGFARPSWPEAETRLTTAQDISKPVVICDDVIDSGAVNTETGLLLTAESRLTCNTEAGNTSGPVTTVTLPLAETAGDISGNMFYPVLVSDECGGSSHISDTRVTGTCVTDTRDDHMDLQQPFPAGATGFIFARPANPCTLASPTVIRSSDPMELLIGSKDQATQHEVIDQRADSEALPSTVVEEQENGGARPEQEPRWADDKEEEEQKWNVLSAQISQNLTTLMKIRDEGLTIRAGYGDGLEQVEGHPAETMGSVAAVLQEAQEATVLLRQFQRKMAREVNLLLHGGHLGLGEELYTALCRVLMFLQTLSDLLLTPTDDTQQTLLQHECLSTDLVPLREALTTVGLEIRALSLTEEPLCLPCVSGLQTCLNTAHLVLTSTQDQLIARPHLLEYQVGAGHTTRLLCVLEEFQMGQSELDHIVKSAPSSQQVNRSTRECPDGRAVIRRASCTLLRGITCLTDLGEERVKTGQTSQGQSQRFLSRSKKFLQVLGTQLAFVQHLFQQEPEALESEEVECALLELRAKALLQLSLEQEVTSQRRLQAWSEWEEGCGQMGRLLDQLDAIVSGEQPEKDDPEEWYAEKHVRTRLEACQHVLVELEQNRAALGCLLDLEELLRHTAAGCSTYVRSAGGALGLQWQSIHRRAEKEIMRCQAIQESWTRFQRESESLGQWQSSGARRHLDSWLALDDATAKNQAAIRGHLTQLLDFSMEMEARAAQKTCIAREGALLLGLVGANSPLLRGRLATLELTWSQNTSDLSTAQERLQQLLLAGWPPSELLLDLEVWVEKAEVRLGEERTKALQAQDATQLSDAMQCLQELKVGVSYGQVLLDFLGQSGPQTVRPADFGALRSDRALFTEQLGALGLRWISLQGELMSQIRETEEMHRTCAHRERRLGRLHTWLSRRATELERRRRPVSQTEARKSLQECQATEENVQDVSLAVQDLRAASARTCEDIQLGMKREHPSDVAFAGQLEGAGRACVALNKQVEGLRSGLQQLVKEWSQFETDLSEASLHTTRWCFILQLQQHTPVFSPKQVRGHLEELKRLQEDAGKGEELWAAVNQSYQSLQSNVNDITAELLKEQIEVAQRQYKEVKQELKQGIQKMGEVLSLWEMYAQHRDSCRQRLQDVRRQLEAFSSATANPQQDTRAIVDSTEDLVEGLQSSVEGLVVGTKPLIELLEPLAGTIIQSDTTTLSHDILLLNQAFVKRKAHIQVDLELHRRFCMRLEALEVQTRTIVSRLGPSTNQLDFTQKIMLDLHDLFLPLMDLSDGSGGCCVRESRGEAERVAALHAQWREALIQASDTYCELKARQYGSQSFLQKAESLAVLQRKVEEDRETTQDTGFSGLLKKLLTQQRVHVEVLSGHRLLQALLRDAVLLLEDTKGEKRSELLSSVAHAKQSWLDCVAGATERRALAEAEFAVWRIFNHGSKLLRKVLASVDPQPDPAEAPPRTLGQLWCSSDGLKHTEAVLSEHTAVYEQTLEAGRRLCASATPDSPCHQQLVVELCALQEEWEQTSTVLGRRAALVNAALRDWSQLKDGLVSTGRKLDDLKTSMELSVLDMKSDAEEEERLIKDNEASLEHLSGGLSELEAARTELCCSVASGDTALLERQLEELHELWEALCEKVSSRRQEIAERLSAWTLFNDKNKELCDWLTRMEGKVCHRGDLSIQDMVEKLKKDCMEEMNVFSENKRHLQQLGEQLLQASDQAKQSQLHGTLQEVNQRWRKLFHHIHTRVKRLKETLTTVQQLDKNMSNMHSWLSRLETRLYQPISYSVCHHHEIQRRLAEHQVLQQDIEQHMEGVASVLSLCDVLHQDEDAQAEGDSLLETSRSLDQRWRAICSMALERRLRIEETWRLWCKFLDDYSRFEDWLKMAERRAANPNSADVLYTVAKEELKKFESFQRQVNERLTQLELVNSQYRRLARENRTDRASQLKDMVHRGNRRWDGLHRRVAAILRRLKHFTGQREDFESTRESMLVWLTELDLKLTNVEHFSESDVHHKIEQLNGFQKEITLNTERIDGLIVFGERLIQKSPALDAAVIEEELEELHSYCQEVFSRLVRFHQRLSMPPMAMEEPELYYNSVSLEESLELIGWPWLGRGQGSLLAMPTHLLSSPLERSGRGTPASVDSLPLEWDHTGDVGGSSSHEDDDDGEEEQKGEEEDETYFSVLSESENSEGEEEYVEVTGECVPEGSTSVSSRSMVMADSPRWQSSDRADTETPTTFHTSTPQKKPSYLHLMSECSGSVEDIKRVSLILDDEEQPEDLGLTGLTSIEQSGVIERWELLQAQSRSNLLTSPQEPVDLTSDLDDITSWLGRAVPKLERLQDCDPATRIQDLEARVKELKEMEKEFACYKSMVLSVNLAAGELQGGGGAVDPDLKRRLGELNRGWSQACTGLQEWENSLRMTLMRCQEFHGRLHSLLLWLAHAESMLYAVDIGQSHTPLRSLQQHRRTLRGLQGELRSRQVQLDSLRALWSQLQPDRGTEEGADAQEKLHVTGSKFTSLLRHVARDLSYLQRRLDCESASSSSAEGGGHSASAASAQRWKKRRTTAQREEKSDEPPPPPSSPSTPPRPPHSFFYRVLRAAFPLHLLFLLLLVLTCLLPGSHSGPGCHLANNFARSFYPMLRYTNGPPPT